MQKRFVALCLSAGVVTLAACGGDSTGTGGDGNLSASEAQALTTALTTSGALGTAAGFAPIVFTKLRETGTMSVTAAAQAAAGISKQMALSVHGGLGDYQAVGIQVRYSYDNNGSPIRGVYSAVIGWDGLNTSVSPATVDHILDAGILEDGGTTFPTSGTADLSQGEGEASYYDRSTGSSYFASEGTVTLSSATFSGSSTDCGASSQGTTVECSYTKGTMKGSFHFTGDKFQGDGPATYTQGNTSFDVPALRFTIATHD